MKGRGGLLGAGRGVWGLEGRLGARSWRGEGVSEFGGRVGQKGEEKGREMGVKRW